MINVTLWLGWSASPLTVRMSEVPLHMYSANDSNARQRDQCLQLEAQRDQCLQLEALYE